MIGNYYRKKFYNIGPWACIIINLRPLIFPYRNKLKCLLLSHFKLSLIFAGKAITNYKGVSRYRLHSGRLGLGRHE